MVFVSMQLLLLVCVWVPVLANLIEYIAFIYPENQGCVSKSLNGMFGRMIFLKVKRPVTQINEQLRTKTRNERALFVGWSRSQHLVLVLYTLPTI